MRGREISLLHSSTRASVSLQGDAWARVESWRGEFAVMRRVDLRSDTVTQPTAAMRRAMAEAPLGDDVFGDDPTVLRLEELAARMLGKEAALFVPSGTMGNNIAIKAHTEPGDEILLDRDAHSLCYEVGAPAVLSGVLTRQFRSRRGIPDVEDIFAAIQPRSLHAPGTALLILENTHNRAGGTVIPLAIHRALRQLTLDRRVKVHLDGARLFNASVASGVSAAEFAACADSVSFCLSKGLGCPVGSVLCGDRAFIAKSRRIRKMLGGGMRQAGILAACGIVALETMIDRLREDHARARRLALALSELPGLQVDLESVQTNMVYLKTDGSAAEIVHRLGQLGILCLPLGENLIRLVTHCDVDDDGIERAVQAFHQISAQP